MHYLTLTVSYLLYPAVSKSVDFEIQVLEPAPEPELESALLESIRETLAPTTFKPSDIVLTVGEESFWPLDSLGDGDKAPTAVEVTFTAGLDAYISFDPVKWIFHYNGDASSANLIGQTYKITIDRIYSRKHKTTTTQLVNIAA